MTITLFLLMAAAIVAGIMAMSVLKGIHSSLFGDAALRKLEGVVPPATSGLLPVMAVAERKGQGRGKRKNGGQFPGVRGLTSQKLDEFGGFEYSYLATNINHED